MNPALAVRESVEEDISINKETEEDIEHKDKMVLEIHSREDDIIELKSQRNKNREDIMSLNERITSLEEEYRSIKIVTTEQTKFQEKVSMELECLTRENT